MQHQPQLCDFFKAMWYQFFTLEPGSVTPSERYYRQLMAYDARQAAWRLNPHLWLRDS